MRNIVLLAAGALASAVVHAQEYAPYKEAAITLHQWETYHNAVQACCQSTRREYKDRGLVTYAKDEGRLGYTFTLENHPAHPACVTREVIPGPDIQMRLIGYYAGNEDEFAKLYESYDQLTNQMVKMIRARTNAQKAQQGAGAAPKPAPQQ